MSKELMLKIIEDFGKEEDSLWTRTKIIVNYHWGIGEDLERKTLQSLFGAENMRSIDVYRNYLTNAGYICVLSRGVYECSDYVLNHLTIEDVKEKGKLYKEQITNSIPF